MCEIQNLSKQTNFNNLIYYFKGQSGPKDFIGFNTLTTNEQFFQLFIKIKDDYTTLEKAEEKQK